MDDLNETYFLNYDIANVSYGGGSVKEILKLLTHLTKP